MRRKTTKTSSYYIMAVISAILSVALVLSAISKYVSPDSSSIMVFLGVATPILIVLNIASAVLWLVKWKTWAIMPIIALLSNWGYVKAMCQIGNEPKFEDNAIKIATYSVNSECNAKDVAEFVKEKNIELICLQEYNGLDSVRNGGDVLNFSCVPNAQVAVYSDYPIINSGSITFNNTSNCAMWCDIVKENDTIRVFNLYLQGSQVSMAEDARKRAHQALIMRRTINETKLPIVVCGNFNDTPSSYTYRVFDEILSDGFKECGSGFGATKGVFRTDYIFSDDNFVVCNYVTEDCNRGGHNLVIADLKLAK